ncbi:hypothetical protein KY285_033799 [Solanum tuberosum]|nr:hypothetical protein KY285_033799 [Solanum tuberosum]
MFRTSIPIHQKVRLHPLSRSQSNLNLRMENSNFSATPQPPPQTPLLFATQSVHPIHQPISWVEMALQGHAPIFSMDINGRIHHNTSELKLLNPVDHKGDETSLGELCQSNVVNQYNESFVTNTSTPPLLQHHASAMEPTSSSQCFPKYDKHGATSFRYSPRDNKLEPYVLPVATNASNPGTPHHDPKPSSHGYSSFSPLGESEGNVIPVPSGSFTEISSLRNSALMLFPEEEDKKYILNCPIALKKCSFDLRPPRSTALAKYAVVMTPTMYQSCFLNKENQGPYVMTRKNDRLSKSL